MKRVSESGFLSLFCSESLNGLEVKVVIKVQVIKVFTVNQKVQHIIALSANLKSRLYPIKLSRLEKLSFLKSFKDVSLSGCFRLLMMKGVLNPAFQKLLI